MSADRGYGNETLKYLLQNQASLPQLDAFWLRWPYRTGPCAAFKTDGQPTSEYKCGNQRVERSVRGLDRPEEVVA